MNRKLNLFTFGLILTLTACASPTAKLKPKISEFKEKYPNHIQSYQVEDRKMAFAWSGDPSKPPLIFVHGSPGDWTGWVEFLLNEDLQKKFHIIAVDRPGYGGSEKGRAELSLKKQAESIFAALAFNTSGQRAILVGHSYGGAVVAEMAARRPDQVAGVVFVASSVAPGLEREKWFQYPASWWPIRLLIPSELRVCNEEILALKTELENLESRWSSITANVATIQGNADDLVPPGNQDFILQRIPAAQILFKRRVVGMNHFVPWQHPELILEAISTLAP